MATGKKNVRDFYNKTAKEWADRWYADDSMLPLLRSFMALLSERPRILDLCCGAGYESMRMAGLGAKVVGIDLSENSIAIAKEKNPALEFHVDNMLNDYSYIGLVDGIVCIAGLVHLPVEQLPAAFRRMDEVLRPGGRVLVTVRDGVGRQAKQSDVEIDGEVYDRAFFAHSLEELRQKAEGILDFEQEISDAEPSMWRNYVFYKPN